LKHRKNSKNSNNTGRNSDKDKDKETVRAGKNRKLTFGNDENTQNNNQNLLKKKAHCPTTGRNTLSIDSKDSNEKTVELKENNANLNDLDEENEIEYMVDNSNKVNIGTSFNKISNLNNIHSDILINNNSKILVVNSTNSINNSNLSRLTKVFISDSSVFNLEDDIKKTKHKNWFEMDSLENGYSGNKVKNQSNFSSLNLDGKYPSTQKKVRKKYKKSEIYENEHDKKQISEEEEEPKEVEQPKEHFQFNFVDFFESKFNIINLIFIYIYSIY